MKFPITLMSFVLVGMFLFMAQPTTAKMSADLPIQEQKVQKKKKLSLKDRMAKRLVSKKLKKHLKKDRNRLNANSSDVIRWILIIAGILIAIALLQSIGGLIGQILGILVLAIVVIFVLQLLGVI